jgi:thymidylate kinase
MAGTALNLNGGSLTAIEILSSIAPASCKRNAAQFPAAHWNLQFENFDIAHAKAAAEILRSRGYRAIGARQVSDTISVIFVRTGKEGLESIGVSVPLCSATDILLRCPRSLFLAIFGPDGVGKSSISSAAASLLGPFFDHQRTVCWRPQLISSRIAKEPHEFKLPHNAPMYGAVRSTIKLTGVYADFLLDHLTLTRNQLRGCSLISWDRYFHDLFVDKRRYRYSGPEWYSDLLLRSLPVPKQFLGIVLDADENIILSRKQELPMDELRRQRLAYRKLAGMLPETHIVRNDGKFECCLQRVLSLVIARMAGEFEPVASKLLGCVSVS